MFATLPGLSKILLVCILLSVLNDACLIEEMQPQQYYPRQEHGGVYHHHHHHPGYPIHHARMQWSPGVPGPWAAYDIAYSSYPPVSGHISSSIASDQTAATPHNIRDILGGNQPGGTLPSEVAKTPSYQKSPSSAGAATGTVFHYPPPGVDLRSPTTPNHPDIPQGFYIPAIPGRPFGKYLLEFKWMH